MVTVYCYISLFATLPSLPPAHCDPLFWIACTIVVQGECRGKLAWPLLSRRPQSQCISKCTANLAIFFDPCKKNQLSNHILSTYINFFQLIPFYLWKATIRSRKLFILFKLVSQNLLLKLWWITGSRFLIIICIICAICGKFLYYFFGVFETFLYLCTINQCLT